MSYSEGASSGNLVLIQKQVASTSAGLTFTSGITGYDYYRLEYYNVTVSNNGANIVLQLSSNAGVSYINTAYYSCGYQCVPGGISTWAQSNIAHHFLVTAQDNAATASANGFCNLYGFASAVIYKDIILYTSQSNAAAPYAVSYTGFLANAAAINALQVIPSAGTFSGTVKLYGVQN